MDVEGLVPQAQGCSWLVDGQSARLDLVATTVSGVSSDDLLTCQSSRFTADGQACRLRGYVRSCCTYYFLRIHITETTNAPLLGLTTSVSSFSCANWFLLSSCPMQQSEGSPSPGTQYIPPGPAAHPATHSIPKCAQGPGSPLSEAPARRD